MTGFAVTAWYAAASGLLLLVLALRVVQARLQHKIGIGDGNNQELSRRIRVHGNAVEYLPMLLILLALCEAAGLNAGVLHGFGLAIVVSRVLHAYGLGRSAGPGFGRFFGTLISFLALLGLSLLLLTRPWWS